MGHENLTPLQTTAILSQLLDRPIAYIQVTIESIQQRLGLMGATPDVQKELGNLFRALGDPDGIYATARTPEAVTPTTFEHFSRNKLLSNIC